MRTLNMDSATGYWRENRHLVAVMDGGGRIQQLAIDRHLEHTPGLQGATPVRPAATQCGQQVIGAAVAPGELLAAGRLQGLQRTEIRDGDHDPSLSTGMWCRMKLQPFNQ